MFEQMQPIGGNNSNGARTVSLQSVGEYVPPDKRMFEYAHAGTELVDATDEVLIDTDANGTVDATNLVFTVAGTPYSLVHVSDRDKLTAKTYRCCGDYLTSASIPLCCLVGIVIIILFQIGIAATCYYYVYPNTVILIDSKLENAFGLALNLGVKNLPAVKENVGCELSKICSKFNDTIYALTMESLDCTFDFDAPGETCPFNFLGLDNTVDSSQVSEALGSKFSTDAPPLSDQLSILKYGSVSTSESS